MAKVINLDTAKAERTAIRNRALVGKLLEGWLSGRVTDTVVIARHVGGAVGIIGNGVPRDEAADMLRTVLGQVGKLEDVVE